MVKMNMKEQNIGTEKIILWSQSFSDIVKSNKIYIDKTDHIVNMAKDFVNKWYFLSHPRRWGKSLLLDTFKEFFLGNKDIFQGTYAYNNWNWWESYPVIVWKFDYYDKEYHNTNLTKFYNDSIYIVFEGKEYLVTDFVPNWITRLSVLITAVYSTFWKQVVVLFDEYDRPLTSFLDDTIMFEKIKSQYIIFFDGVKLIDRHIRFFYISGLTKTVQDTLFSTLNNLCDITFSKGYCDILWYTEEEIKHYYWAFIPKICERLWCTKDMLFDELKKFYGWYFFWSDEKKMYNPWNINSFFKYGEFSWYWIWTWNPNIIGRYLINLSNEEILKIINDVKKGKCSIPKEYLQIHNLKDNFFLKIMLLSGYFTYVWTDTDKVKITNKETKKAIDWFLKNLKAE